MSKPDGFLLRGAAFSSEESAFEMLVHSREQELRFHETWEKEAKPYFFNDNQPKLSIPKNIAELADKEFNQGDDVLSFGFSTTEFGFANEDLRYWVTNYGEYDEVATERANILSAYLAGKALGVELVEVEG